MKKFITKQDFKTNREKGVCFFVVSTTNRQQINANLEHLHRRIVENSRLAADEAAKVILNR